MVLVAGVTFGLNFCRNGRSKVCCANVPAELRVKCSQLIGRQNLTAYRGWKGDLAAITVEYEKNKAIGLELNAWKGYLVADDDGRVLARLKSADANLVIPS